MDLNSIRAKSLKMQDLYRKLNEKRGDKRWTYRDYVEGLSADIGELQKLMVAKAGYRKLDDVDERIKHELMDVLWSVFVIAKELDVDLESTADGYFDEFEKVVQKSLEE